MPVPGILLAEIFASANSLRAAGLIVEYALGGALALTGLSLRLFFCGII